MRSADSTISCRFVAPILALIALLQAGSFAQEGTQKLPVKVSWSVELPAAPMFPPIIAGDRVIVAHLPGVVAAYAATDGRLAWSAPLRADAPLAVDGDRVLVLAGEALHALRASDGEVLWRAPTGTSTVPAVAKEGWTVVAGSGTLRALRSTDGSSVWTREVAHLQQPPAIFGNTLIVGTADGFFRSHDLRSGEILWTTQIGGSPGEPLIAIDRIYVGASDKRFYCLDALDGEIKWFQKIGASVPMKAAADGERVYMVGLDNLVRAFDARSGNGRWHQGVPFRPFVGPRVPGEAATAVVMTGPTTEIFLFAPRGGQKLPSVTFPDVLVEAPAIRQGDAGVYEFFGLTGSLEAGYKLSLVVSAPGQG